MPKTALIVDDSASARFVLGGMLSEQSLSVDTAASGEEALEYLRHARPDVIFMDHLMPGMDGFQALEAIKENPATATIPVMMYTSQEGELYVGQARALGAPLSSPGSNGAPTVVCPSRCRTCRSPACARRRRGR